MGHKISKEQIDPSVKDHIMSFVGDINELETDEKSNIISAVNSLITDRVSDNVNMSKLANSIGTLVTASDNIDEVVTKVDDLTSQFKSKLLGLGVYIESSDRFKSLIEKVATLTVGDGSNLQFATGACELDQTYESGNATFNFTESLSFTPTYFFARIPEVGFTVDPIEGTYIRNLILTNFLDYDKRPQPANVTTTHITISNVTNTGFTISLGSGESISGYLLSDETISSAIDWYAIGVGEGEDDTALRDSLASILIDEGVEVADTDTMADLIIKVDEEFDRKNSRGSLDIISAAELPATGVENQICVISSNPTDNIIISSDSNDQVSSSIYCSLSYNPGNVVYTVNSGNMTVKYNMLFFNQDGNILSSYIYENGKWNQFTLNRIFLMENGYMVNEAVFGGLLKTDTNYIYDLIYSAGSGLSAVASNSDFTFFISSNNMVDFNNFNYVAIELTADLDLNGSGNYEYGTIYVSSTTTRIRGSSYTSSIDSLTSKQDTTTPQTYYTDGVYNYYTFDISSWASIGYFTIFFGNTTYTPYTRIRNIYLY